MSISQKEDYTFKIIIAGDTQVGKTTYFQLLQDIRKSYIDTSSTIGVDLSLLRYKINNKHIKIQLWDTAGQERYRAITRTYFRNICGIILMFDVTRPATFDNLKKWIDMLNYASCCTHRHPILLLGNKTELTNNIDSSTFNNFINYYSIQYNIRYCEISCKEDNNYLEEIFVSFIDDICKNININECHGIQIANDNNNLSKLLKYNRNNQTIENNKCCTIM